MNTADSPYLPENDEEREFLALYRTKNYPRPSVTADVAAIRIGESWNGRTGAEVLLIRRGQFPYRNCWALPGGFFQEGETIEECALRELREETNLEVHSLRQIACFSRPDRDPRGWIISNAFLAVLHSDAAPNSNVQAGDDAADARWFQAEFHPEGETPELRLTCGPICISQKFRVFSTFTSPAWLLPVTADSAASPIPERLAFDHAEILGNAFRILAQTTPDLK